MAFVNGRFSTRIGGTWDTERVGAGLALQIASHARRKSANDNDDSLGIVRTEEEKTTSSRIVAVIAYSGLLTFDQKLLLTVALLLVEFIINNNSPESALSPNRSDKKHHPSSEQISLDDDSELIRLNALYPDVIAFLHSILQFNVKSDLTSSQADKIQIYISPEGMLRVNSLIICVSGVAQLESLIDDGVSTTVVVDTETKVHVDSMNTRRAALGLRELDVVEIPVLRDYLKSDHIFR